MALIYFDTEFTGLHKNTTLISIGLVSDCGKKLYCECTDYDKSQVDDWIYKNVISNLWNGNIKNPTIEYYIGKSEDISKKITNWLKQFETVQFVSDVCHYDFVLLIDLLYKHALNMPYNRHSAYCHDINSDIAIAYNISYIDAFNKNRESILYGNKVLLDVDIEKHNAIYDAIVIKEIYELLGS